MSELLFDDQIVIETERLLLLEMRPKHIHQLFELKTKADILLYLGMEETIKSYLAQLIPISSK